MYDSLITVCAVEPGVQIPFVMKMLAPLIPITSLNSSKEQVNLLAHSLQNKHFRIQTHVGVFVMLRRLILIRFLAAGADCVLLCWRKEREVFHLLFQSNYVENWNAQGSHAGLLHKGCCCKLNAILFVCTMVMYWQMARAHQHTSQSMLKSFVFVLIIQVEYTVGVSGEPHAVEYITSFFLWQNEATGWWTIGFRCPCLHGDPVQGEGTVGRTGITLFIRP